MIVLVVAGALEGLISTAQLHLSLGVASPFLVSYQANIIFYVIRYS